MTTTDPTPTLLRRAATKLREICVSREDYGWKVDTDDPLHITDGITPVATTYTPEDAKAIVLMGPTVALAMANVFEHLANPYVCTPGDETRHGELLLALARAVLREPAEEVGDRG